MGFIKRYLAKRKLRKLEAYEKKLREMERSSVKDKESRQVKDDLKSLNLGFKGHYINRDASMSFIVLVAVCILIIVGLTIFYQSKFGELNELFDQKLGELNQAYESLTTKESELKEKESTLTITQAGKQDLENQYLDVKSDLENVQDENALLKNTIEDLNNQLKIEKDKNDNLRREIENLKERIEELEE